LHHTFTLSILQPGLELLESLPMRQRKITVCPFAAAGMFAIVVMNPPELPVHADRPAMGLPQQGLIANTL